MIIHTTVNCFVRVCMRRFSWVVGGAQALDAGALPTATASFKAFCCHFLLIRSMMCCSQLSAMDVSVRSTMKGAAKCDKHCELQNSVNRQGLERILCFWDIPESMPASVSMLFRPSSNCLVLGMPRRVIVPHGVHLLLRHTMRYKMR